MFLRSFSLKIYRNMRWALERWIKEWNCFKELFMAYLKTIMKALIDRKPVDWKESMWG